MQTGAGTLQDNACIAPLPQQNLPGRAARWHRHSLGSESQSAWVAAGKAGAGCKEVGACCADTCRRRANKQAKTTGINQLTLLLDASFGHGQKTK